MNPQAKKTYTQAQILKDLMTVTDHEQASAYMLGLCLNWLAQELATDPQLRAQWERWITTKRHSLKRGS